MKAVVKNIYYTLFIFLIWYLVYLAKILDTVIPSPLSVINLILSKEIIIILDSLFISLYTVLIALIISITIGYFIGIISSFYENVNSILYPFFNGLKSLPITVFLPLFIAIFHLDYFIIPMISVPLIATLSVNISNASTTVNKSRKDIVSSLKINKIAYFKHILFWETQETLLSTLRILLTYALTLEIALDYFLRYHQGIGNYINSHYESYADDKYVYMYAGIVVASYVGVLLVKSLDYISRRVLKWKIQI